MTVSKNVRTRSLPGWASAMAGGCALLAFTTPGLAQSVVPTHGVVTSGAASISQSGANLNITQTTPRAVVNWQDFSIGASNSVIFNQPGASSAILNRVTSSAPSTLAGQLQANGQVYLINPNGIAITRGGVVKVGGGFVASTLGISDADFNSGNLNFNGTGASAAVSNAGSIHAAPGGFVSLLGGTVSNEGSISVPVGKVGLGSGEQATLNLSGDNFLQVAIPTGAKAADGKSLVDMSGKVVAPGGTVVLKAATVAKAIRDAVNVPGEISASSARASGGTIILGGGEGGDVHVAGRLNASGTRRGGAVHIIGHDVALTNAKIAATSAKGAGGKATVTATRAITLAGSSVDVSGATAGGVIHLGAHAAHASSAQTADSVSTDAATRLVADATSQGDGGSIGIWSNRLTSFGGYASAQGGPLGGMGGLVETSSAGQLTIAQGAFVDASALGGAAGLWLLDPSNLTITATEAATISASLTAGTNVLEQTTATTTTGPGLVSPGAGDIIVASEIAWTGGATLTLDAFNSVFLHIPATTVSGNLINAPAGHLVMTAGQDIIQQTAGTIAAATLSANATAGSVVLTAGNSVTSTVSGSGPLGFSFFNNVSTFAGSISAPSGTIYLASDGSIFQNAPFTALSLFAETSQNSILLTNTGNSIQTVSGNIGPTSGPAGYFELTNVRSSLTIGPVSGFVSTRTDTPASVAFPAGILAPGSDPTQHISVGVANTGDLIVNSPVTTQDFAGNVVLAASGSFINNVGAGAIVTPISWTGHWEVYSAAPGGDVFGALDSGHTAIWDTPFSTATPIVTNSNHYVFAFQPTVTFTSGDLSKTYGTDVTAAVAADYTVTGLQPGVAGAYLADTANSVYLGAPSVTSTGSPASASVSGSPYPILVALGPLEVFDGYAFAAASTGRLTVSPLALTYAVANANGTYGTTATLGAATLTGVLPSDTVIPTVGAFSGATPVTLGPRTAAGTYSELVTGLSNSNYSIATTGNTPGVLTISPLALTFAVANANSTYGTTPVLGAATLTGVLAGDIVTPTVGAFSGVTPVALAPTTPVGTYIERVTALSNPNYSLSPTGNTQGALTVSPRALTFSVANANGTYGTTAVLGAATLNGVVAGDTVTPTVGAFSGATPVTLAPRTPAGTYSELVTAISNPNYVLASTGNTPGVLTISPLALTFSVANSNSTYGTTPVLGAATLTGVLTGDTVTPTVGAFSGATPVTLAARTPAGTYSELVTALSNPNYSLAATGNTPGVLTVSPLALTFAVANANSTYGTTPVLGAATLTGVLAGDVVTPTVGAFTGAAPVALAPTTPVGTYAERVTALSNANYVIAPTGNTPGVLTISPLALTFSVANASAMFGTTPVLGAATLNGVVPGDTVIPTVQAFSGGAPVALGPTTPNGRYAELVTAITNANYTLSPTGNAPGVLTVGLQPVAGANPAVYTYGVGPTSNGIFESWPPLARTCTAGPDLPNPNRFSDPFAALDAMSKAMASFCERCNNPTISSLADALERYAAELEVLAPRLPPQLRNLPTIVRDAARQVRAARSVAEAVGAMSVAIARVNKDISLLRAENPDALPSSVQVGRNVSATLEQVKIKLLRVSEL